MKKRFTEEQIIKALGRMNSGTAAKDLCRELGVIASGQELCLHRVLFDISKRSLLNWGSRPPPPAGEGGL